MKIPALTVAFGASLLAHAMVFGALQLFRPATRAAGPGFAAGQIIEISVERKGDDAVVSAGLSSAPEAVTPAAPVQAPAVSELPPIPEPYVDHAVFIPAARAEELNVHDRPLPPPAREASAELVAANRSGPQSSSANPASCTSSASDVSSIGLDYLLNPKPIYPREARKRRQEGLVVLAAWINTAGQPEQIEIKQSSGFTVLDAAAEGAVRSWRFTPARIGTVAIAASVEIPVRFKLTATKRVGN